MTEQPGGLPDRIAEVIRKHRLDSGPNWDTKWRCSCDPSLEFVTKRDQAIHAAEAVVAALREHIESITDVGQLDVFVDPADGYRSMRSPSAEMVARRIFGEVERSEHGWAVTPWVGVLGEERIDPYLATMMEDEQ